MPNRHCSVRARKCGYSRPTELLEMEQLTSKHGIEAEVSRVLRVPGRTRTATLKRPRVLFVGEGVTLAHVVRPLQLASQLDPSHFEVRFACDPRYQHLVENKALEHLPIHTIPTEQFLKRVYKAGPLFSLEELQAAVREDLQLITRVKPDVLVGDFRLSLGISAELAGVPYLALSNAHWSPKAHLPCPVPDHPLVRLLGVRVMRQILRVTLPLFFGLQAKHFNRLRRAYGLQPVEGRGAHEVFTRGTRTLYLDIPELYGNESLSDSETFIGPVFWEPDVSLPDWWDSLPEDKPRVFVTPGSSGNAEATTQLIRILSEMDVSVIIATAGRTPTTSLPRGAFAADYLPGRAITRKADLVVCNGGSPMVYLALSQGTPVLGLPVNLDQYYVMDAIERIGAGRSIRVAEVRRRAASTISDLLGNEAYVRTAESLGKRIAGFNAARCLVEAIRSVVQPAQRRSERHRQEVATYV